MGLSRHSFPPLDKEFLWNIQYISFSGSFWPTPFWGGWVKPLWAAAKRRRLINRGFLNVPFSPVYGLAAVLFATFLPELKNTPFFLFLFGLIIATGLELFTGILLEHLSGQKWWDYSRYRFQFEGHICLGYSLLWGGMALLCLYLATPCWSGWPD